MNARLSSPEGPWLRILGSSGGCPGPGRACSGYLVGDEHTRLLLDCGPGVVSVLRSVEDYARIDGIILSHMHPDHYLDLVPYSYGLMMDLVSSGEGEPIPLYLPPGGSATLGSLDVALGHAGWELPDDGRFGPGCPALARRFRESGGLLQAIFAVREYLPGDEFELGGFRLSFHPVDHTVEAFGMRVRCGGGVLAYSGDTRAFPGLVEMADGADILLCDSTVSRSDNTTFGGHMSAAEAGRVAEEAGVKRLILTHVYGEGQRRELLRREASGCFAGPVEVATETALYAIAPAAVR